MSGWKEQAKRRREREEKEKEEFCLTEADKQPVSKAEKDQIFIDCLINKKTSPKAVILPPSLPSKPAPSPSPEKALIDKLEYCDLEAKKAPNSKLRRGIIRDCYGKALKEYEEALARTEQKAQEEDCWKEAQKAPNAVARADFVAYCVQDTIFEKDQNAQVRSSSVNRSVPAVPQSQPTVKPESIPQSKIEPLRFPVAGVHLVKGPMEPGHVVCTYSTSLAVPQFVKSELANLYKGNPQLYYKALGVYARVFAEGVKDWCKLVQDFLNCDFTQRKFAEYLENPKMRYGEIREPGKKAKINDCAYSVLFNTMKGMVALGTKLSNPESLKARKEPRGFAELLSVQPYAVGSYLLTGHLPYSFKRLLAVEWGVTPSWVRNTMFGWRRKLDNLKVFQAVFPQFLLNSVRPQTASLRDAIEAALGGKLPLEVTQVLNILQKGHLLHLLCMEKEIPLGLFKKELREVAEQLRRQLAGTINLTRFYPNHLELTADEFRTVAETIIRNVDATLQEMKPKLEGKEKEERGE